MNNSVVMFLAVCLFGFGAAATPGDTGCTGTLEGKKIDLLLGYDVHGQYVPSLMQIQQYGAVVFESPDVQEEMINVGTEENPFYNQTWVANDEESTATVRIPEQNPTDEKLSVFLTVETDSGLFKVNELAMTCER